MDEVSQPDYSESVPGCLLWETELSLHLNSVSWQMTTVDRQRRSLASQLLSEETWTLLSLSLAQVLLEEEDPS